MSVFESFKYKRKDTFIHNLDPRTKLIMVIVLSAVSLMFFEIVPLLIILVINTILIAIAKSLREWYYTLKGLLYLLILVFVFNYFLVSPIFGIITVLRLLALASSFSVFFLTVHPDDLTQALIQMKIPFDYAFSLSLAIRFVPTIAQESQSIMDAQMSRGLELQKGSLIQKARNYLPILVPLIVNSIRRALQIAESLESRGFGAEEKRTYLYELKMRFSDYLVICLFLTSFLLLLLDRYFLLQYLFS
ncbi:MAG: energy-coupling factor transporter transmembrane component T family protein [Candidatus Asgardarchaeia archaeon]